MPETAQAKRTAYTKTVDLDVRQKAFIVAYAQLGSPTLGDGTKSAITAGYSRVSAAGQASRMLKRANVRRAIDAIQRAHAIQLQAQTIVDRAFMQVALLQMVETCREAEDRTNALRALEDLGRLYGLYSDNVTVSASPRVAMTDTQRAEAQRVLDAMYSQGRMLDAASEDAVSPVLTNNERVQQPATELEAGLDAVSGQAEAAPATSDNQAGGIPPKPAGSLNELPPP